jgi:hypothetical protein
MSNEIRARYTSGSTLYAVLLRGSDGDAYYTVTPAFEVPTASHWTSYALTMTEQSTTGLYYGNMPGSLAAGRYDVLVFLRAGGSAATTDTLVAQAAIDWTGAADLSLGAIANIASFALDSSGRVTVGSNADKTGYSLTQSFPTNFASLAITSGGAVTAGTVSDKTGYSLTQSFPSNFSSLAVTAAGGVTLADGVAHGGTPGSSTATLALGSVEVSATGDAVTFASSAGNGLVCQGASGTAGILAGGGSSSYGISTQGTGVGLLAAGGTTGVGLEVQGGTTSGNGLVVQTTLGHAVSLSAQGSAKNGVTVTTTAGDGISSQAAGSGRHGLYLQGGTDSYGLYCVGQGTGHGVRIQGDATGDGLHCEGGATSGAGLLVQAHGGASPGIYALGGAGPGIYSLGDTGSHGIQAVGGTNGNGLRCQGQGSGHDVYLAGDGVLLGDLAGTTDGVSAAGAATFFAVDSGTTEAAAVAGSVVHEVAANAGGSVTVAGYASGQSPATLVLGATASSWNTAGTIGHAINASGSLSDPLQNAVPGTYASGTAGNAISKLLVSPITVASPVTAAGDVNLIRGDGYLAADGRALVYTDAANAWPDNVTGRWKLYRPDGTVALSKAATVAPATGTGKTASVDVTGAETAALLGAQYQLALILTLPDTSLMTVVRGYCNVENP